MRLNIRHRTHYRYSAPIEYGLQLIRLTPLDHAGQRVHGWTVSTDDGQALPSTDDGFGNVVHMMTVERGRQEAAVVAQGTVETVDTDGVLRALTEPVPAAYFLRQTTATMLDRPGAELADQVRGVDDPVDQLHRLMDGIRRAVTFEIATTTVETSGAEALAAGRGVCQDFGHIFVGCARHLGVPARYVSGYLWTGEAAQSFEASHAWAEARVAGFGWVGFDAANGQCPTEAYVRVAAGLDYRSAAPVTGLWRGEAEESLAVTVEVQQLQAQQ